MDLRELMALARALNIDPGIPATQYGTSVPVGHPTGPGLPPLLTTEICRISLEHPWMARAWEVSWSVEQPREPRGIDGATTIDALPSAGNSRVLIRWGIGGAQHTIEADMWPGGSVTVTAQQVSIAAVPNASETAQLSATISPAPGKRRAVIYRTDSLFTVGTGATVQRATPNYARRVTIMRNNVDDGSAWTLTQALANPAPPPLPFCDSTFQQGAAGAYSFGEFVPLVSFPNIVRVTNGGASGENASLVWELEI